jgi:hypothetical protein
MLLLVASDSYAKTVLTTSLALWFVIWAIRYRGESDRKLDPIALRLRWAIVVGTHALVIFASKWLMYPATRIALWAVGAAFLAWPNLAYHLTESLRRCRVIKNQVASDDEKS